MMIGFVRLRVRARIKSIGFGKIEYRFWGIEVKTLVRVWGFENMGV